MLRFLILYGTTDGHTAKVANAVALTLQEQYARATVVDAASDAGNVGPERYDGVIVAASVHAGGYQSAVKRWLMQNADALRDKPSAFISVCLGVLQHDPKVDRELMAIMDRFFAQTRWRPSMREIVAGALPYTRYNWLKRWIMRRIVSKAHGDTDASRDYEYTNWDDLRAFTRDFLRSVRSRAAAAAPPSEAA